jgi:hypothetical protein
MFAAVIFIIGITFLLGVIPAEGLPVRTQQMWGRHGVVRREAAADAIAFLFFLALHLHTIKCLSGYFNLTSLTARSVSPNFVGIQDWEK